jgi:hypothetical protein
MALTNEEREEWKAKIAASEAFEHVPEVSMHAACALDEPSEVLKHAPDDVCDDDEIARFAIEKDPRNFRLCSDRLRDNIDLARIVVEKEPSYFERCSDRLQDDDFFARFAVEKEPRNFRLCSDRLRDNIDLARIVVEKDQFFFYCCSDRLHDNIDLVRSAVEKYPSNFDCCSSRLRDDDEFARFAVEKDPYNFQRCSDRLQADPIMQAYKTLVEAERKKQPNLSAFPKPIRDAWNIQTPMLSSGSNDQEARNIFACLAKPAMEAEARRSQPSASDQVQNAAPLGSGVSAEDLLPELAAFDIDPNADPYANHPARALKPASNDDDGLDHDLRRGPR